jgi:hypothetical protein
MTPFDVLKKTHARHIAEHGHALVGVFPSNDTPGQVFTYTIGRALVGDPELILVGLDNRSAAVILNRLVEVMTANASPWVQGPVGIGGQFPVYLKHTEDFVKDAYTSQASNYLEDLPYTVMQVVLCDTQGRFPWDDGCDEMFKTLQTLEPG